MWVPLRVLLDSALTLLNDDTVPAGSKLAGSFLALLKDNVAPAIDMADSVLLNGEANYDGYVRAPLTFTGPFTGQGSFSLLADGANVFQPDGSDTVNTIVGQFIVGSDSVTCLAVELFDQPIPLPLPMSGFVVTPIFGLGPNISGYGKSVVSN